MQEKSIALPDTLSALVVLAVGDLVKCEESADYRINMNMWHEPDFDDDEDRTICDVCMAGAVMAQTGQADLTEELDPSIYTEDTGGKLSALNKMREGDIYSAVQRFRHNIPNLPDQLMPDPELPEGIKPQYAVPSYYDDKDGFKKAMLDLAEKLAAVGL